MSGDGLPQDIVGGSECSDVLHWNNPRRTNIDALNREIALNGAYEDNLMLERGKITGFNTTCTKGEDEQTTVGRVLVDQVASDSYFLASNNGEKIKVPSEINATIKHYTYGSCNNEKQYGLNKDSIVFVDTSETILSEETYSFSIGRVLKTESSTYFCYSASRILSPWFCNSKENTTESVLYLGKIENETLRIARLVDVTGRHHLNPEMLLESVLWLDVFPDVYKNSGYETAIKKWDGLRRLTYTLVKTASAPSIAEEIVPAVVGTRTVAVLKMSGIIYLASSGVLVMTMLCIYASVRFARRNTPVTKVPTDAAYVIDLIESDKLNDGMCWSPIRSGVGVVLTKIAENHYHVTLGEQGSKFLGGRVHGKKMEAEQEELSLTSRPVNVRFVALNEELANVLERQLRK